MITVACNIDSVLALDASYKHAFLMKPAGKIPPTMVKTQTHLVFFTVQLQSYVFFFFSVINILIYTHVYRRAAGGLGFQYSVQKETRKNVLIFLFRQKLLCLFLVKYSLKTCYFHFIRLSHATSTHSKKTCPYDLFFFRKKLYAYHNSLCTFPSAFGCCVAGNDKFNGLIHTTGISMRLYILPLPPERKKAEVRAHPYNAFLFYANRIWNLVILKVKSFLPLYF